MSTNNELPLSPQLSSAARATANRPASTDELARVKRELMQAEVRLAKARATAAAAEVDIKVLTVRLKALAR